MRADETVQARRQPACRERGRRAYRERTLLVHRAQLSNGFGETIEAFAKLRQQQLARARQLQPALQTPEQTLAELLFQPLDLVADRRRRDMQLLGRHGEAHLARRSLESPQTVEGREAAF